MGKAASWLNAVVMLLLSLVSCAPSAKVPVTRPAEINLSGITRIAIGEVEGNAGAALSDVLAQKLFESGRFEVLDRQNIISVLEEHQLNHSGVVDEKTAVEIGKILGASAVIYGRSTARYSQRREVGDEYKCGKKTCRTYEKIGEGWLEASLRVVDLETGKIIAIKSYSEADSERTRDVNAWPEDVDENAVMGRIFNATGEKFMRMIAPYTELVSVEFEDSDLLEVKSGIASAQSGQWELAREQFRAAVDANPGDPGAWFNLGLANMYTNEFDDALAAFNRSNALAPSSMCAREIANCARLKAEKSRLEAQMPRQ